MANSDLTLQWSKLVSLTESEIKKLPKEIESVYRISKKAPDEKFYVVFIGSGLNLEDDLRKLLSEKDFLKQKGEFSFRYAPIKGEETRRAIEKQMYKQYAPTYNSKEPESSLDVRANLN
jgi:hypothetical protein